MPLLSVVAGCTSVAERQTAEAPRMGLPLEFNSVMRPTCTTCADSNGTKQDKTINKKHLFRLYFEKQVITDNIEKHGKIIGFSH